MKVFVIVILLQHLYCPSFCIYIKTMLFQTNAFYQGNVLLSESLFESFFMSVVNQ